MILSFIFIRQLQNLDRYSCSINLEFYQFINQKISIFAPQNLHRQLHSFKTDLDYEKLNFGYKKRSFSFKTDVVFENLNFRALKIL